MAVVATNYKWILYGILAGITLLILWNHDDAREYYRSKTSAVGLTTGSAGSKTDLVESKTGLVESNKEPIQVIITQTAEPTIEFVTVSVTLSQPTPTSPPLDHNGEISEALTAEQCETLFPEAYFEVNRAVAYWKDREHTIDRDDLHISWFNTIPFPQNGGAARILIHNNELRILETATLITHPAFRSRCMSTLILLQRALAAASAAGETLPTIEFAMALDDVVDYEHEDDTSSLWTWTAKSTSESHKRHWLMPNFDFFTGHMDSYHRVREKAALQDGPWFTKIPKVIWRGTAWFNAVRIKLIEVAKEKDWSDVQAFDWGTMEGYLTVDEMCRYAFTMHTEGGSFSGRLKYLLNCDTPVIIHELEWRTYWYHLLIPDGPDQNYIPVKNDFSDLEEKVQYYLDHPDEAEKIIDNALKRFRHQYLTPAAQTCYIRRMIHGYSSVSFTPEIWREKKGREGELPTLRGESFEDFVSSFEEVAPGAAE